MSGNQKQVAKLDGFQRINFLYQMSHLAVRQSSSSTSLARFYALTLDSISKKGVIKLDASIKRDICKKCFSLLIPGITATVRLRKKRKKCYQVLTCHKCQSVKRFTVNVECQQSCQPSSQQPCQLSSQQSSQPQT